MRIVFMGTPQFAVPSLQALLDSAHEVVGVYSQPPRPAGRGKKLQASPVHQLAEQYSVPVFTPEKLKGDEVLVQMEALEADIAVVAAYGLLLPKAVLKMFAHGCINVHPSDLPRWRGAAPIQHTIMAGDSKTAMCIMQMEQGLDTGPVLLRHAVDVPERCTAGELHDQLAEISGGLVLETLAQIEAGEAKPIPQAEAGVTYAHKITRELQHIDWAKPAEEVVQLIRGLSPWPGAYFMYAGERIKCLQADVEHDARDFTPGSIVDRQLGIAAVGGVVRPEIVQRPGKKPMKLEDCLRGMEVKVGERVS